MLSAAQMGRMSRLLAQALELDSEERQRRLAALPAEHRDLEPALRRALVSEDRETSGCGASATLPPEKAAGAESDFDVLPRGLCRNDAIGWPASRNARGVAKGDRQKLEAMGLGARLLELRPEIRIGRGARATGEGRCGI